MSSLTLGRRYLWLRAGLPEPVGAGFFRLEPKFSPGSGSYSYSSVPVLLFLWDLSMTKYDYDYDDYD